MKRLLFLVAALVCIVVIAGEVSIWTVSIFFGEYSIQWPLLFAGLTLSIAPTVIMFLIFSRFFIAGMTQGVIK